MCFHHFFDRLPLFGHETREAIPPHTQHLNIISMRFCSILSVACLLLVSGCGGQKLPDGMPKLTPTVLTITCDGAPLDGALVSLIPLDPANSRWNAGGTTDKDGKLKARTMAQYDGVAPGKYKITVQKTVLDPLPEGLSPAELMTYKRKPPQEFVHKKFHDKKTTPLELEVGSSAVAETLEVEKP